MQCGTERPSVQSFCTNSWDSERFVITRLVGAKNSQFCLPHIIAGCVDGESYRASLTGPSVAGYRGRRNQQSSPPHPPFLDENAAEHSDISKA